MIKVGVGTFLIQREKYFFNLSSSISIGSNYFNRNSKRYGAFHLFRIVSITTLQQCFDIGLSIFATLYRAPSRYYHKWPGYRSTSRLLLYILHARYCTYRTSPRFSPTGPRALKTTEYAIAAMATLYKCYRNQNPKFTQTPITTPQCYTHLHNIQTTRQVHSFHPTPQPFQSGSPQITLPTTLNPCRNRYSPKTSYPLQR